MHRNSLLMFLIFLSVLIIIEAELPLAHHKINWMKNYFGQIERKNFISENKKLIGNITPTKTRVKFTKNVSPKYYEARTTSKEDEKSILNNITEFPINDVISDNVLFKRTLGFKFKHKGIRAKKWWRQRRHRRKNYRLRKNDVKSKNKFSFSQMCYQDVKELTEYFTKTRNVYSTRTVLIKDIIPTYVYASLVSTKWDEIEETFILFKTRGVSTVVEKSTVPYAVTTYTTVYETVFKQLDVTLTYYYPRYETKVSSVMVTETKAVVEQFTIFETAYKPIQRTVTSFTPVIVLITVFEPRTVGVTYTQWAVYEDCPHTHDQEYLGSNHVKTIKQNDDFEQLVTKMTKLIGTNESHTKHGQSNLVGDLESVDTFEFSRLKKFDTVPIDGPIAIDGPIPKTNKIPKGKRFNSSYGKFISLPRDVLSAISDKHRITSALVDRPNHNYTKEEEGDEEFSSIDSKHRLQSSLENEIYSN